MFSSWCKKKKKNERESLDSRSDGNTEVVRWNDNSVVTIVSNAYGVQPIGSAKRWIKEKGKQNIQQPAVIDACNQGMGGADLLDHASSDLRPVICWKKWYWPLVIVPSIFHLYTDISGETITQKDFRLHIEDIMIRQSKRRVISFDSRLTRLTEWLMKWDLMG